MHTNELIAEAQREQRRPWYRPSLTVQIMIALVLGGVLGYFGHTHDLAAADADKWHIGDKVFFLRDIFLNLIKSVIAPLVFSTLVVGIAGGGDLKKVGRMGTKSLIYFEIVTTIALFLGLLIVNITKPGVGVKLPQSAAAATTVAANHPKTFVETIVHIFPSNIVDAMARGDVLQIVAFAVLFAMAVTAIGERGKPVIAFMDSLAQVMFRFTSYVMMFAPIGVAAAMAHTVDTQGVGVLENLAKLIGSLYLALALFIVFVLGGVMLVCRIPILNFFRAIREPATIAFATTSSESALPKAMEQMERFGVPARIVGFVMPTGYSFNLDGTTLYLTLASVFVAQAAEATSGVHVGLGTQLQMLLTLMLTSKGVAGVPRASMVILLGTLDTYLPGYGALGVALIVGIDELMDMARSCTNVIGNCLATCVVARWEGEFDDLRARNYGTPNEILIAKQREQEAEIAEAISDVRAKVKEIAEDGGEVLVTTVITRD